MEMKQSTSITSKKLYGIIRTILYILKKTSSKNIPWYELHMMLKRSTKLAGKAIGNLLLEHQTLTCRPNNIHTNFITPIEYKFSCKNTKRKNNRHYYYSAGTHCSPLTPEKSPLTILGFGEGPNVPELRVTDSPFPENNTVEDTDTLQVDMAAEEFIKNFYQELKQQKKRAAVEPPSPSYYRRWGQVY